MCVYIYREREWVPQQLSPAQRSPVKPAQPSSTQPSPSHVSQSKTVQQNTVFGFSQIWQCSRLLPLGCAGLGWAGVGGWAVGE